MTPKHQLLMCVAILALFSMLLFIVFGDHGFADLNRLKSKRDQLVKSNETLARQNLLFYDKIDRLKTDPVFIESIARKDLGMIGRDELIVKPGPSKNLP